MYQETYSHQRLTRSRVHARIAGVCAGLSVYLGINLTLIRLIFVSLVFVNGIGLVLYLILLAVIPLDPVVAPAPSPVSRASLLTLIVGIVSVLATLIGFFSDVATIVNGLASLP